MDRSNIVKDINIRLQSYKFDLESIDEHNKLYTI